MKEASKSGVVGVVVVVVVVVIGEFIVGPKSGLSNCIVAARLHIFSSITRY
jgi:hypothetical protein